MRGFDSRPGLKYMSKLFRHIFEAWSKPPARLACGNRKPERVLCSASWRSKGQRGGVASSYERSELETRGRFPPRPHSYAGVAKLVDALALGASGVIHGGSSPLPSTKPRNSKRLALSDYCFVVQGEDLKASAGTWLEGQVA